jgi:hypothetical protein
LFAFAPFYPPSSENHNNRTPRPRRCSFFLRRRPLPPDRARTKKTLEIEIAIAFRHHHPYTTTTTIPPLENNHNKHMEKTSRCDVIAREQPHPPTKKNERNLLFQRGGGGGVAAKSSESGRKKGEKEKRVGVPILF